MEYREYAVVARRELLDELEAAGFSPTVAGDLPRLRILRDEGIAWREDSSSCLHRFQPTSSRTTLTCSGR